MLWWKCFDLSNSPRGSEGPRGLESHCENCYLNLKSVLNFLRPDGGLTSEGPSQPGPELPWLPQLPQPLLQTPQIATPTSAKAPWVFNSLCRHSCCVFCLGWLPSPPRDSHSSSQDWNVIYRNPSRSDHLLPTALCFYLYFILPPSVVFWSISSTSGAGCGGTHL